MEGRIRYRSYDDQRGVRKFVTEILVDNMEMLSPKATANAAGANAPETAPQPVQPRQEEKSDDEVLPF